MPELATPSPTTAEADAAVRVRRPRLAAALGRLAYGSAVLGLVALNAWWWWGDRPTADLAAIEALIRIHRDDQAEGALRSLLRRSPFDGDARTTLARLLGKREEYLDCAEQLRLVPDWWPTKADALFLEGQAFKLANRARDAEAAWRRTLADDPLHPMPLRGLYAASRELVGIYLTELRLDEAREALMIALDRGDPADRGGILAHRMQVELNRIRPDVAAETLRAFVAADPGDWQARRALARAEQEAGRPEEADRQIARCLAEHPDEPIVWRTYLEILHLRGDRERLQEAVDRLPPAAASDAELWKYRGLALAQRDDLEGADRAFTEAVRLNPHVFEYHYRLATNANRLGQSDRAARHLERHRALKEADAQLRDALNAYLDVSSQAEPDEGALRVAVEHLALLCEQLGWPREAAAWRMLLPPEGGSEAAPGPPT